MSFLPSDYIAMDLLASARDDVFTVADFLKYAKRDTVRRYLNRLTARNDLRRVLPSIYVKQENGILLAPLNPIKLAQAVGRLHQCKVWPLGISALYYFGFPVERQPQWIFASTRYIKPITCNGERYLFHTRLLSEITGQTTKSLAAIAAISTLGSDPDLQRKLIAIRAALTDVDLLALAERAGELQHIIGSLVLSLLRLEFKTGNEDSPDYLEKRKLFEASAESSSNAMNLTSGTLTEAERRNWEIETWKAYYSAKANVKYDSEGDR